jgi:hypothetical protein
MMRAPKRPPADKRLLFIKKSGDTVDARQLQTFFRGHGRENGRKPGSEHGLSSTRGTDIEDIVASAGSEQRGALCQLLPADARKARQQELFFRRILIDRRFRKGRAACKKIQKFRKRRDAAAGDALYDASFPQILHGKKTAGKACVPGGADHGNDSVDRKDLPAEGKFSGEKRILCERIGKIAVRAEKGRGDRKIISTAFFPDVARGKADSDVTGLQADPGVCDGGAHPVRGLTHRLGERPDKRDLGETVFHIRFAADKETVCAAEAGTEGSE